MGAPFAVVYSILALVVYIGAQELDPINNMCIRYDHQSVLKNNTLYIDGGRETFINVNDADSNTQQTGPITEGYNNYLIAIDMTTSWDWKVNISETALNKTANPRTGTAPPVLSRGALYHGSDQDNNIYLWGGTTSYGNESFPGYEPPTSKQYSLWSYNIVEREWDQFDVTLGSPNRPNSGSFTDATDQGLAFYFNGELDSGSSVDTQCFGDNYKQYLEGMIVIDTNNQTSKNLSTQAVSGDMPRARGRMQYVNGVGPNGILVQIGGNQQSVYNHSNSSLANLLPLNEIDVFDVSSYYNTSTPDGTWYKQTTSGQTPGARIDFCLILASAPDESSHNIYMYGGRGANDYIFDDVWILSIPSFTWTQVYQGTAPRFGHTCHRAGDRTMITVGGAANLNYSQPPCDWETKGVGVLDMSDLTWGSVYNASATDYSVPPLLTTIIGGSPSGGATMRQPAGGFNQSGLSNLFRSVSQGNSSDSPSTPTAILPTATSTTPISSPLPEAPRPGAQVAPLVGGLVGGLTSLAVLVSAGIRFKETLRRYCRHLRRMVTRNDSLALEMDSSVKMSAKEMMASEQCWELSAIEKPTELWSPITEKELPAIPLKLLADLKSTYYHTTVREERPEGDPWEWI